MFSSWGKRLFKKLYSKPYIVVTNTVTGVVSISIGDVLQQNLEHAWSKESGQSELATSTNYQHLHQQMTSSEQSSNGMVWDSQRTKNMMYAGVYFSLFGHYWYSFLDKCFPPKTANAVRKKVLAEMGMGPLLVSSVFFIVGWRKSQSFEQSWEHMKSNFPVICGVEWLVYIPLQWLNFSYVPAQFRYLYVAAISIGYDAFLSYILHRNERYQKRLYKATETSKEKPPAIGSGSLKNC